MEERKILVVDDDRIILETLVGAFGRAGYSARAATSAEEALNILNQESIPLMFIDLGLEKMNGFELCENIRKDSSHAIIYALTGYYGLFGDHEIDEAGFDGWLAKPFKVEMLYKVAKESFYRLDKLAEPKAIKRILIADDDEQFRKMLRQMLECEGYEIGEAANGKEAIRNYSVQPFDLVITDIIMPEKEGLETIVDIKNKDPEAKFIVVSGTKWFGANVEFEIAQTLGAQTLQKPFERNKLLEAINQA